MGFSARQNLLQIGDLSSYLYHPQKEILSQEEHPLPEVLDLQ